MEILNANIRESSAGKSARKIRRNGNVPGILYGKSMRNCMFEISEMELNREIYQNGQHGIIKVEIDGEIHEALIKEVQREPVSHKLIHIDLEELKGNKIITANIPINYTGESHLNERGAVVQKEKSSVKVSCTPEKLPKYITLDLSKAKIGNIYKLADMEVANEISILEDLNSIVASISFEQKVEEIID